MKNDRKTPWFRYAVGLSLLLLCACAPIVKPHLATKNDTPIDWGMDNTFESAITVLPFDTPDIKPVWGQYAARQMQEYLLEHKAFRRVLIADKEPVTTPLILKGEVGNLYYGGTFLPTRVYITIRVINRADGQTRFLRKASAECEKRGFSPEFLARYYASSPYPEELLNGLLRIAAKDIAKRTGGSGAAATGTGQN